MTTTNRIRFFIESIWINHPLLQAPHTSPEWVSVLQQDDHQIMDHQASITWRPPPSGLPSLHPDKWPSHIQPGMSEIRDRAKAAPVKSQKFRDTMFAGFRLKVPFSFARSSGKEISWTRRYDTLPVRKIWLFWAGRGTAKYRARNGNVPFEFVHGKNSVPLPSKAKKNLKRNFQFSG